jgi:hypothetical protein
MSQPAKGTRPTKRERKARRIARVSRRARYLAGGALILGVVLAAFTRFESYESLYDAEYVGSETCGECHTVIYDRWQDSPHAKMAREASAESVVGNFVDGQYMLPEAAWVYPEDSELPAAIMYVQDGYYTMAIRKPGTRQFIPYVVHYVVGYQYRQEYLALETGGVLRRLPLQWSVEAQEFFPYWNVQEGSLPTLDDLWVQITVLNSAWNLFCARCHTTHLVIHEKNETHTFARAEWTDLGIACEACHGPGSQHVNYFAHNYVNRVAAFVNSKLRGEPVAYVANAPKLSRGEDLSVCARCHGADIMMSMQDIYRTYEPGYSREGRTNDISQYFQAVPLEPGRTTATVEVYSDGTPKGIGMLFRSFIESDHYAQTDMRCYDCHDPHDNKQPALPGILESSNNSNGYCLACHTELDGQETAHSFHAEGTPGWYCYDCHAPHRITNLATGIWHLTRTHDFSSIPNPADSITYGLENSPNACNECHADQTAQWALEQMAEWWGGR